MITIRELFTENRFPSGWKLIPVLIYLPVGLVLATIRVFIVLQVIIAAILLYKLTKIRSVVLRFMWGILGVFVFTENKEVEDDSVKIIVSNHVTIFDHLAIHLLRDSVSVNISELPSFFHFALNYKDLGNYRNQENLVQNVKSLINENITVDIQPEIGITSGQKGLLRFSTWPCKLSYPIQPVAIKVWRPSLTDIAPSIVNTSWSSEVFWFLFVPFTFFTVRYIPAIRRHENETPEEMSKRLEKVIADELKISSTNFTATDKVEFEKRLCSEMNTVKQPMVQTPIDPSLMEMASRVKEVLPDVPINVICKDLGFALSKADGYWKLRTVERVYGWCDAYLARTRSVDLTIANFLEGLVKYIPEKNPFTAPTPKTTVPDTKASLNAGQPSTSFDTSSKIFHKSAQERMVSFQERKLRLIQSARQRYIEKHALNIMNSS